MPQKLDIINGRPFVEVREKIAALPLLIVICIVQYSCDSQLFVETDSKKETCPKIWSNNDTIDSFLEK